MLPITPLSLALLPAAKRLVMAVFPGEAEFAAASMDDYLAGGAVAVEFKRLQFWILPDEHGNALGCIGIYIVDGLPGEAWMGWFAVAAEARGQGLGRLLVRFAVAEARKRGFHTFRLWTTDSADMAASARLYTQEGFLPEEAGVYSDGSPLIVRTLFLSPQPGLRWHDIPVWPADIGGATPCRQGRPG